MQPDLFKIDGFVIKSLTVFTIAGFIVLTILLWTELRKISKSKNYIFDLVVLTLIISPLIGRFSYILTHFSSFTQRGWYFFPLKDEVGGISYFQSLPWAFFSLWDGGMHFYYIPLAYMISSLIIVKLARLNKKWDMILPKLWLSFMPAYLIILIGLLLDGAYKGKAFQGILGIRYKFDTEDRLAVQFIEILALLGIAIIYVSFQKRQSASKKFLALFYPLIWIIFEILL